MLYETQFYSFTILQLIELFYYRNVYEKRYRWWEINKPVTTRVKTFVNDAFVKKKR